MVVRKSLLLSILWILLFSGPASALAPQEAQAWESIAPGIDYQKYQLPDPNNVFVARMDRANLGLTLDSTIAQGKISGSRETVSGMFARYDQALNYWGGSANPPTWGMRNQAVVAINGSYFDLNNGVPWSGQVQSGWYARRFDDLGGGSGFAWTLNRIPFIGDCVFHRPEKQLITYPATSITQQITHVNTLRGAGELELYTPQYNTQTGTDNSGVEVVVEMTRPSMILPAPRYASGVVQQVRPSQGNSLIPFNSIVLSASGAAAQILLQNVQVGSEVRVSQEITSYESDCTTPESLDWTKTYASVADGYSFLKAGQILDYTDPGATTRHPRTAIAFNDQYIFFLVVDGRDVQHSVGMSIHELAVFTRDTLGATWGVAQDGGGSSTMVINGQVVNNTFCNIYTCMAKNKIYLPRVESNHQIGNVGVSAMNDVISSPAGTERAVANGMLMVIVQPPVYSTTFLPGDGVTTLTNTDVRLGPGTNYASFSTLPMGTHGNIMDQMNGLDGVLAKSNYWWYVNFGGMTGWVPEAVLVKSVSGGVK